MRLQKKHFFLIFFVVSVLTAGAVLQWTVRFDTAERLIAAVNDTGSIPAAMTVMYGSQNLDPVNETETALFCSSAPVTTVQTDKYGRPPKEPNQKNTVQFPIDINTADAALLEKIPGIGPVLAERIIAYRTQNGPFTDVNSLRKVKGIGEKTLEKIRSYITVTMKEGT